MSCMSPNAYNLEQSKFLGPWRYSKHKKSIPHSLKWFKDNQEINPVIPIPCSKCFYCKVNRANIWALRSELESRNFKYKWFITLTYNDESIPIVKQLELQDESTGEIDYSYYSTLDIKHLQTFFRLWRQKMKRLGAVDFKLKYLAAGEYGDNTNRAHYHMVVFANYDIPESMRLLRTEIKQGNRANYFQSTWLDSIWKRGFVDIAPFVPATAKYVASYSVKNLHSFKVRFSSCVYKKPFITTSKNFGIQYLVDNIDKILYTKSVVSSLNFKANNNRVWKSGIEWLENNGYYNQANLLKDFYKANAKAYNDSLVNESLESYTFRINQLKQLAFIKNSKFNK